MIPELAERASHTTKGKTMLDIVTTTPKAIENCKARGGDIWSTHHDIGDVSLYENFAKFRPVPIEAVLSLGNGIEEPQRMADFSALQNVATGNVIDVTPFKGSYTLKPHDLLMAEQADVVQRSELPLGNVEVIDRIFEEGVRVHRTILFHDLTSRIGSGSDVVRCRLDMFNSVDKSWAFQIFSGAYRDLCRNTLVFGGEKAYHQKKKHVGSMSTEAMTHKAVMGLDMWSNQSEQMKLWQQAKMTDRQFTDILKETICRKNTKAAELEESVSINERKLNYLLERFAEEKRELGQTMWAAYNALTHWATHLPDAQERGRAEKKRFDRNGAVRGIIEGPAWQYLEGLAARPSVTAGA
jgi:hypothetical protein